MKTIAQQLNVKDFPFIIKDSQDNRIYYEDSDGYWEKSSFDSQSNRIYFEDSDCFWEKCIFDSQGNLIYSEDSAGFWTKRKYDSFGNQIYYENSKGFIEDNRNIPEYTMDELVEKIGHFKLKTK